MDGGYITATLLNAALQSNTERGREFPMRLELRLHIRDLLLGGGDGIDAGNEAPPLSFLVRDRGEIEMMSASRSSLRSSRPHC